MGAAPTAGTKGVGPLHPTRRLPTAALLLGCATLMAFLLALDLYELLPPVSLAPLSDAAPPGAVLVVVVVLAEGIASAYLVSTGRHVLDGPFVTHYGVRMLAAGGVVVACGIVLFLVWYSAGQWFAEASGWLVEIGVLAMLCGAALLLSALAVLASAIVSPWVEADAT